MPRSWDDNRQSCHAAKLLWPDDYALADRYDQHKGRADARRRMQHRYEGWRMLNNLADLAETAAAAARDLRRCS